MNLKEFNDIKSLSYLDYCQYLQSKYGIGLTNYFTKNWNKIKKVSRTKEGLVTHHLDEDKMIMLSTADYAKGCPFEWQEKEHLVYCDYLEHLFLHALICKYPSPDKLPLVNVGIGGIINFIAPELNDLYSGFITNQAWRINCHKKVINDFDTYLEILKFFLSLYNAEEKAFYKKYIKHSYNANYGLWKNENNKDIYRMIDTL